MAHHTAIAATSQAILTLLDRAAPGGGLPRMPEFKHYRSDDLQNPLPQGPTIRVTLYLHRVTVSQARMVTAPRVDPDGRRYLPSIPLDLHYLVTAWANDALIQQQVLGWAIRVLEDTPTIPPGLLNAHSPGDDVFRPTETVELLWQSLGVQELSDIWEVANQNRQPSAAYLARMVEIESRVPIEEHEPVQTRELDYVPNGDRVGGPA
jgi:hypothetical protein